MVSQNGRISAFLTMFMICFFCRVLMIRQILMSEENIFNDDDDDDDNDDDADNDDGEEEL